jgi:hypothetical protein
MPRFIRNHPIWFALLALLLAYGLWWLYQDYELTAYPRRVAASIPVPNNTTLVQQKEFINKKCRSSGIILYFASNSSWEEIEEFYKNYFVEPKWVAWVGETSYIIDQYSRNQFTSATIHEITNPEDDIQKRTQSMGVTAYILHVGYAQSVYINNTFCKPED